MTPPTLRLVQQQPGNAELDLLFRSLARDARRIRIASAFVSPFASGGILSDIGVEVRPVIIVGRETTPLQVEAIERLREHADVRIWTGGSTFHPKLYLFEGADSTHVLLGSSNFTTGGFVRNIEANLHFELPTRDPLIVSLLDQYAAWELDSTPATDEWILALRRMAEIQAMAQELLLNDTEATNARAEIERLIAAEFERRAAESAAAESQRLAGRPFFTREHFLAFVPSKHTSEAGTVVLERTAVSNRFLELHEELLPVIRLARWDLHPNPMKQHITSSRHLVPGFVSQISAMWLSYGRSKSRFAELQDYEADEQYGFYNHMKLQVLIDDSMVRFGLMIAQRNNLWDRHYLKQKLGLVSTKGIEVEVDRIVTLLRNAGRVEPRAYFEREPHSAPHTRERMALSGITREALLSIVTRDEEGNWLGIWVDQAPTDAAVSEGQILDTTRRTFDNLYPLYDLLAWYPKKP